MFDLVPSKGAFAETRELYSRVSKVIPEPDWYRFAPYIVEINRLKKERNAVLLAHNYMTPEIFHGVGDIVGDSLQLAIEAKKIEQDIIVQCGVHFMAETSKILSPKKTVLIPDANAGCSLAESIKAKNVFELKRQYPGVPVVTYVNTTAEVKAASDICCTSSNALQIVESLDGNSVIMAPDGFLARNIANQTNKRIIWWEGTCMVHERFTAEEIRAYRESNPEIAIIAHPECHPSVVAEADFSGSTGAMISWVHRNKPKKVLLVTECSMSDNVAVEAKETEFIRPCNLCPHMKKITLENILESLVNLTTEVVLDEKLIEPARNAIEKMIEVSNNVRKQN